MPEQRSGHTFEIAVILNYFYDFYVYKFGNIIPSSDPDYTVTFTDYTDPYLSTSLSLTATVQSDNTDIVCRNQGDQLSMTCTVQIIG